MMPSNPETRRGDSVAPPARAHCLQHVPFEGPGSIAPWLVAHGYRLSHTRFYESTGLPDPAAIDFLVIMGGPMSVHDEDRYPWLAAEKRFVREVIDSGKPVLGVCLGAQIIAQAMGAKVFRNPRKEIGWFPVRPTAPGARGAMSGFATAETVFHWHGETFDLPPGAERLASSEGCANQAFQLGRRVIGLQFHLETTPESLRAIVSHCREELVPGTYVQSGEEILSAKADRFLRINHLMGDVLAFLAGDDGPGAVWARIDAQ